MDGNEVEDNEVELVVVVVVVVDTIVVVELGGGDDALRDFLQFLHFFTTFSCVTVFSVFFDT